MSLLHYMGQTGHTFLRKLFATYFVSNFTSKCQDHEAKNSEVYEFKILTS